MELTTLRSHWLLYELTTTHTVITRTWICSKEVIGVGCFFSYTAGYLQHLGLFRTVFQNFLLNSEGNLRFGTSTAVCDNHSEVNTKYCFVNRPK